MSDRIEEAAEVLRSSRRTVFFTGAGVSAESGIPTFRDDDGFWRRFPMEQFGNWQGLLRTARHEPRRLAEYAHGVLGPIANAEPNAAHLAIAEVEKHVERVEIVTQNIDRLHQEAGSRRVLEVHGTLFAKQSRGGRPRGSVSAASLRRVADRLEKAQSGRFPLAQFLLAIRPLMGVGWRGVYHPAVVMFGDALAEPAWSQAQAACEQCDCLIQIGASGAVYPAALLPDMASQSGACVIAIDPEPTQADIWISGLASDVLPRLVKRAFSD